MRCWGFGGDGQLGYANTSTIGDNEAPGSAGRLTSAPGAAPWRSAPGWLTPARCSTTGRVRCWGFGGDGRARLRQHEHASATTRPRARPGRSTSAGRTRRRSAAGDSHTCAVLDDGSVRCWGNGFYGQLGDGLNAIGRRGQRPVPGRAGRPRRRAHREGDQRRARVTPARCSTTHGALLGLWRQRPARLWRARSAVGDDEAAGLGRPGEPRPGRTRKGDQRRRRPHLRACSTTAACAAGASTTTASSATPTRLRSATTRRQARSAPVNLGRGAPRPRSAPARPHLRAARRRQRALLGLRRRRPARLRQHDDDRRQRDARLGRAGEPRRRAHAPWRSARASSHTCARLDDGSVRCWGYGGNGRLGFCSERNIGDDETPGPRRRSMLAASARTVRTALRAAVPARHGQPGRPPRTPTASPAQAARAGARCAAASQGARATHARELRRARRLSGTRRARARRHARATAASCAAAASSATGARPGGSRAERRAPSRARASRSASTRPAPTATAPPAARTYLVKQSRRPIRSARAFRRAQTLCNGSCRFPSDTRVGASSRSRSPTCARAPPTTTRSRRATTSRAGSGARSRTVRARTPGEGGEGGGGHGGPEGTGPTSPRAPAGTCSARRG